MKIGVEIVKSRNWSDSLIFIRTWGEWSITSKGKNKVQKLRNTDKSMKFSQKKFPKLGSMMVKK